MRSSRLLLLLAATTMTATGCGEAGPNVVDQLAGEIHLHQFPAGSHAWAGFLPETLSVHHLHTDQLIELTFEPASRDGACALYVTPSCQPQCATGTYCAATGSCRAAPMPRYLDVGEIRVTGSRIVPAIRLFYDPVVTTYGSEPPPGSALLWQGGEKLSVRGGRGDFAVAGFVNAPNPVRVTRPDLTVPLRFPRDAALDLAWQADGANQMVITLHASTRDGRAAYIKCVTADTGSLPVPKAMMAALPPPPRDIRIEVERSEERILPIARRGVGVIARAAFSAWANGTE